jgi:RNA polymerase sigma-70 factor (ECF subfamily)
MVKGLSMTEQTKSDLMLVQAAQSGDRHAFNELVCRHRSGVVNVVYRMCGDAELAEEAAQEAFLRAWQHLPSYNPLYAFRSWLYRIAVNAALDALRRERPGLDEPDELPHPNPIQPEAALESAQRAELVRQAVLALPPACRAVVVLREYEGLSYQEIGMALGIPVGTVMSRLSYGRGQLRLALAACLEAL